MKTSIPFITACILALGLLLNNTATLVKNYTAPAPPFSDSTIQLQRDISKFLKEAKRNIVILSGDSPFTSGGTGFSIQAASGQIVTITNAHVCSLAVDGEMIATYDDGLVTTLSVIEIVKTKADLCVLSSLPLTENKMIYTLAAQGLEIGDAAFTIGHPRLAPLTFSNGYLVDDTDIDIIDIEIRDIEACKEIGGTMKTVPTFFGDAELCAVPFHAISTSLVVYPGSSGSPVFNFQGQVVGVIFAQSSDTTYGAYVPFDDLKALLDKY
jgi:S1-C subfamily serine protease